MKRPKFFGERFEAIMAELKTRDLSKVPTNTLLKLALLYSEKAKAERSSWDLIED
jgi:hypothetical protein